MEVFRAGTDEGAAGTDEGEGQELEETDPEHSSVPSVGERNRQPQTRLRAGSSVRRGTAAAADPGDPGRFLWRKVRELLRRAHWTQDNRQ